MNLLKVNNKHTRRTSLTLLWYLSCELWGDFTPCSDVCTVDFEQVNVHWDYIHSRSFSHGFTQSLFDNFFFSLIFMELLLENKRKVMDDYLFNIKFTLSKTGLKMLCHGESISTIHCITEMIYAYPGMSGDLSGEISWFLSPSSLSQLCQSDRKKQFITNLLSKIMH